MYTIDRINRVLVVYGLAPVMPDYLARTGTLDLDNHFTTHNPHPGHKVMDELDKHAGIETGGNLGERVLRHEEQLTWRRFIRA
jgi:hypothetical protein